MKVKKVVLGVTALLATAGLIIVQPTLNVRAYGANTALEDTELTLEDMLTYAIQDEYMAQAEYQAILTNLGEVRPFTRILKAEERHIALLTPLFKAYGIPLVADESANYLVVPATLEEALSAGVTAETNNIAMYTAFLAQDLPEDMKTVFTELKIASEHHLKAFSKNPHGPHGGMNGEPKGPKAGEPEVTPTMGGNGPIGKGPWGKGPKGDK